MIMGVGVIPTGVGIFNGIQNPFLSSVMANLI